MLFACSLFMAVSDMLKNNQLKSQPMFVGSQNFTKLTPYPNNQIKPYKETPVSSIPSLFSSASDLFGNSRNTIQPAVYFTFGNETNDYRAYSRTNNSNQPNNYSSIVGSFGMIALNSNSSNSSYSAMPQKEKPFSGGTLLEFDDGGGGFDDGDGAGNDNDEGSNGAPVGNALILLLFAAGYFGVRKQFLNKQA